MNNFQNDRQSKLLSSEHYSYSLWKEIMKYTFSNPIHMEVRLLKSFCKTLGFAVDTYAHTVICF